MYKLFNGSELLAESTSPIVYSDMANGWCIGDVVFVDTERSFHVSKPAPQVSPVQFKLLFTVAERVAIKASEDAMVKDFFEIVNDPRLTFVDLGLESTKQALAYLHSKNLIGEGRVDQILTGVIQ